jgi:hypothetical protein
MTDGTTNTATGATIDSEAAVPVTGPSLLLRGVQKAFADVVAVDGLDLEVKRGESEWRWQDDDH